MAKKLLLLFIAVPLTSKFAGATEPVSQEKLAEAIGKALPLIEQSALTYTKHRTCFSCHHQALPAMTIATAKARGWKTDESKLNQIVEFTAKSLKRAEKNYQKGKGQGGRADTAGYALAALQSGGWKADSITEAVAHFLLVWSKDQPYWRPSGNRPPSEASRFTTTYLALRALTHFATAKQKADMEQRKLKARPWVLQTKPKDTEDRVFQLRCMTYLNVDNKAIDRAASELIKQQNKDGGWAQTDKLDSDAYATGSVLVVLHEVGGLSTDDSVYQRGVRFLLDSQLEDGSWHVKSRSKPFQLYFESGFPHKKDQFISIAASSWATMALLHAWLPNNDAPDVVPSTCEQTSAGQNQPQPEVTWPKLKAGDSFYQQVTILQKPRMQIQGLTIPSQMQYSIGSEFVIREVTEKGELQVQQTIQSVTLGQTDGLSKQIIMQALQKLKGSKFNITLNASREVVKLEGVPQNLMIHPKEVLGGQGFQLASLLDEDGWKELIEATFFVPHSPMHPGQKWSRKMTHSWGPLGKWAGQVNYLYSSKKNQVHQIDYFYGMKHFPPDGKGAALPLKISKAAFQPVSTKGIILFDSQIGRVTHVQELFHVRGVMNIAVLGMNTQVLLDEQQLFEVRILPKNPSEK